MYLSWDSSKNITVAKVKAYHAVGIGCLANWESQTGAPLLGAAQGKADATEAVRQLQALIKGAKLKPKNRIVIYFSCDHEVTSANFAKIDAYFKAAKAICLAAGFGIGVYGQASLVDHLANAGITDAEWQTLAWSNGVLSANADFYQYAINEHVDGASVDYDSVIHPDKLGALWPADSPYNVEGDEVALNDSDIDKIVKAIWTHKGGPANAQDSMQHMVVVASTKATSIEKTLGDVHDRLSAVQTLVGNAVTRLASLGSAVAALKPEAAEKLDTAAVVSGVVSGIKALAWKAN